jgi:hypothetical protein
MAPSSRDCSVFLYTLVLFAGSLLPFVIGMSGWLYLLTAVLLGAWFILLAFMLWRDYSDLLARKTFRFSILASVAALRSLAGRPLPEAMAPMKPLSRRTAGVALLALAVAACDSRSGGKARPSRPSTSPVPTTRSSALPTPRALTHPGRLQGQGGGGVLRLHPVPGRLPDHAGRTGRGEASAGSRRRPRARCVRHGRSRSATLPEVLKAYVASFGSDIRSACAALPSRPQAAPPARPARTRRGRCAAVQAFERLAHLLHRGHLDLADALGADAVLGGQLVQRHAARAVVVDLQPALFDDAAAARVQHRQRGSMPSPASQSRLAGFEHAGGLVRVVGQVGDRGEALSPSSFCGSSATSPPAMRVSISITSSRLDVQLARHDVDLGRRQRVAVRVGVGRRRP